MQGRSLWLGLLLLWSAVAGATGVSVRELRDDPPAGEVLAGQHDARLLPATAEPVIRQRHSEAQWWRIDAREPVASEGSPQLVLRSPFLYHVEAWVPGRATPSRHALYGPLADDRYSHRALVIDLPQGMPAGTAVWLRIERRSAMVTPVSVELLDDVHRRDLAFVAWRAMVLSSLAVLAVLALAFWGGTGERSYAWFGAMLLCAIGYLAAIGGDLRWVPGAEILFGSSARTQRVFGCLGVVFSNLFQRAYLDLPKKMPLLDRLLAAATAAAAAGAVLSLFVEWSHWVGNLTLLFSAAVLLAASCVLSVRGDRPGRVVLLSWTPLMVFSFLASAQMMGNWTGTDWLGEGLAASFVAASLLLAIGLSDKLLELRRDRDHASRQAQIDPVTKALNRHGIEEWLRKRIEQSRRGPTPLSIAFVDVDHFKAINDRHGHGIGDQCLRIVSWRLRNQLRSEDMIGRYGGDEFLVVLPDCALAEATVIAERMRESMNCRAISIADASIPVTLSIGVAELAADESMDSLFERADAALYAGKTGGRDRVETSPPSEGSWSV